MLRLSIIPFLTKILSHMVQFSSRDLIDGQAALLVLCGEPKAALATSEEMRGEERWRHRCTR
jgi:hypothetical protein